MKQKHVLLYSIILISGIVFLSINEARAYKGSRGKSDSDDNSYLAPRRLIELRPYANAIYANNLYEKEIKNGVGYGGGLKMRAQIYGDIGYILNVSVDKIDVKNEESNDFLSIFTGGFYYSYKTRYGDIRFDLSYGAISTGTNAMTIFLPGIELHRPLTPRVGYVIEIGYPIVNDWIVKSDFQEYYSSFVLSCGIAMKF